MTTLNKLAHLTKKYGEEERGSMALSFAVSALTLLVAAGSAYDVSQLHASKAKAQLVSDTVGLTATAYVKNNGKPPKNSKEGFMHNVTYSAKAQGFDMGPATRGKSDVKFKVVYDQKNSQATVYMTGGLEAAFMGMFGYNNLEFKSKSVVKYSASDLKDPASVFLVMDNSGSMAWDDKLLTNSNKRPAGAQARISGLRKTVTDFNNYLGKAVGTSTDKNATKYLRTGMTAYNSSLIGARTVTPRWGTLPQTKINTMVAGGGTDSRQSMNKVYSWMKGENAKHKQESGNDKPLKYVIFMTDGVNNQEYVCEWQNKSRTSYWRKKKRNGQYRYKYSWKKPRGSGWVEGKETCSYKTTANDQTLQTCTKLKKDGVQIYTIGYALEPGKYASSPPSSYYTTTQSQSSATTAYKFLESCASSKDHFVKAEDTTALEEAFDKIGADIIADVIRIAS